MTLDHTELNGNFAGVRVIEIADELAEYCGLALAGLGADVIKVEPPGGSSTRSIGPRSGPSWNWPSSCSAGPGRGWPC